MTVPGVRPIAIAAVAAAVILGGIWLVPSDAYVEWAGERANYCKAASDCRVASAGGLHFPIVNVDEVAGMEMLGQRYALFHETPMYGVVDARDLSRIACVKNKCVAPRKDLR